MLDSIQTGNVEIIVKKISNEFRITWLGEADERDATKVLRPFLERNASGAKLSSSTVVLDFSRLKFMNSACIGIVVNFVKSMDRKNMRVKVIFNTDITWQVLSKRCTATIFALSDNIDVIDVSKKIRGVQSKDWSKAAPKRPTGKARGARMLKHVTDEQRRQSGCSDGELDQSLNCRSLKEAPTFASIGSQSNGP